MDEYQEMKKFIQVAATFMRTKSEKCAGDLQTHLQIISSASDISVFNPDSPVAPMFYVCLHEIMTDLDPHSPLVWPTISALQKACDNRKARESLIHTYKFIPVVSRFVNVSDKQHKVLQILQELTYGLRITWQEAHLSQLVLTLSHVIMGKNKDHKSQALNVLVNLCYKNTPVLYVLTRKVEIKTFIRCVTKMNESPSVRMLVCKMLIILSELKGPLSETDMLHFVDVSFNCITDAFNRHDLTTLQQMSEFFIDMERNSQFKAVMEKYPKIVEDTKRLLDLVENSNDGSEPSQECISVLLRFIGNALQIKTAKTIKLAPRILAAVTPWIDCDKTCIAALGLVHLVTESYVQNTDNTHDEIVHIYSTILKTVSKLLSCENEQIMNPGYREKLGALLILLADMSAWPNLRNQVLNTINHQDIKHIFEELHDHNYFNEQSLKDNNDSDVSIHLIFLVATLAEYDCDWMSLYGDLLGTTQILLSLSVSVMNGGKDTKLKVLKLLGNAKFNDEKLKALSEIMTEMKIEGKVEKVELKQPTLQEPMPLLVSVNRVDELLEHLHQNNIIEPRTSEVMELYEYKLVSMAHTERRLQSALEAADTQCTGLNHQVALLKSEISQLHQTLFCVQQTLEGNSMEKNDLINQITKLTAETTLEKTTNVQKIKQLTKRLQEIEEGYKERSAELESVTSQLQGELSKNEHLMFVVEAKSAECDEVGSKLVEARSKCEDLIKLKVLTEELLEKAKSDIAEYEMQIADFKSDTEDLKSSLEACLEENIDKDNKITELTKQIQYLEQIREAVISVAGKRGNF